MCFAPQRRALFRHLNLQKWREHAVFCTFWLRNVLHATTACTVFFRGFVAPEGWKVGSLKRRVRRHLGRWEMKSCTPLWREAHLEVKCVKNWGVRTTFGKLRCWKKCTPLWREAHFEVKMYKTPHVRATFWRFRWSVSRLSYLFAHLHLLSSDLFSSDSSPCWLLSHLSILSEVWLPNFLR